MNDEYILYNLLGGDYILFALVTRLSCWWK